jgi:hypothetical protein
MISRNEKRIWTKKEISHGKCEYCATVIHHLDRSEAQPHQWAMLFELDFQFGIEPEDKFCAMTLACVDEGGP